MAGHHKLAKKDSAGLKPTISHGYKDGSTFYYLAKGSDGKPIRNFKGHEGDFIWIPRTKVIAKAGQEDDAIKALRKDQKTAEAMAEKKFPTKEKPKPKKEKPKKEKPEGKDIKQQILDTAKKYGLDTKEVEGIIAINDIRNLIERGDRDGAVIKFIDAAKKSLGKEALEKIQEELIPDDGSGDSFTIQAIRWLGGDGAADIAKDIEKHASGDDGVFVGLGNGALEKVDEFAKEYLGEGNVNAFTGNFSSLGTHVSGVASSIKTGGTKGFLHKMTSFVFDNLGLQNNMGSWGEPTRKWIDSAIDTTMDWVNKRPPFFKTMLFFAVLGAPIGMALSAIPLGKLIPIPFLGTMIDGVKGVAANLLKFAPLIGGVGVAVGLVSEATGAGRNFFGKMSSPSEEKNNQRIIIKGEGITTSVDDNAIDWNRLNGQDPAFKKSAIEEVAPTESLGANGQAPNNYDKVLNDGGGQIDFGKIKDYQPVSASDVIKSTASLDNGNSTLEEALRLLDNGTDTETVRASTNNGQQRKNTITDIG